MLSTTASPNPSSSMFIRHLIHKEEKLSGDTKMSLLQALTGTQTPFISFASESNKKD